MNMFKKVFHLHEWETKTGTGVYSKKRNAPPLRMYPVQRRKCKICGKVEDIIPDRRIP